MNYYVIVVISTIFVISGIFLFMNFSEDVNVEEINLKEDIYEEKINNFLIPAQRFQINQDLEYDKKYNFDNTSLFQGFGIEGIHYKKISSNTNTWTSVDVYPIPEMVEKYDELGLKNNPQNSIVIYPLFTSSAYSSNGFYDYYNNECNQACLTVQVQESFISPASGIGIQVLKLLDYSIITDVDFAKNPSIINQYDKVILLHNEYVTRDMFDSIVNHPKVLYLYPNALYAEIEFDLIKNEITLIRGHGYPDSSIDNGFNWKFDNTRPYEFDSKCENWDFYKIDNGMMLNCYPEKIITHDQDLLKFIKEF